MQVTVWQDKARAAGFDRMVIHDRDEGDATEVGNFLSLYRSSEAWSRWGFARSGRRIRAWCCLSGVDVGEFDCMADALEAVLHGITVPTSIRTRSKAGRLAPLPPLFPGKLGSAA